MWGRCHDEILTFLTCDTCGSFAPLILPTLDDFNDITPFSKEPSSTVVRPAIENYVKIRSTKSNVVPIDYRNYEPP